MKKIYTLLFIIVLLIVGYLVLRNTQGNPSVQNEGREYTLEDIKSIYGLQDVEYGPEKVDKFEFIRGMTSYDPGFGEPPMFKYIFNPDTYELIIEESYKGELKNTENVSPETKSGSDVKLYSISIPSGTGGAGYYLFVIMPDDNAFVAVMPDVDLTSIKENFFYLESIESIN